MPLGWECLRANWGGPSVVGWNRLRSMRLPERYHPFLPYLPAVAAFILVLPVMGFTYLWDDYSFLTNAFFYQLHDWASGSTSREQQFGLLRADGTKKPAYQVVQAALQNYRG